MCVRCVSLVTGYCGAREALGVFRHHPLARNRVGESIPGGSHAHRVPDLQSVLPRCSFRAPAVGPGPLILYHGRNCPDGFGAALAAWLYYGDSAQYLGLDHGEIHTVDDLPPVQGRAVYILDFSFAPAVLRAIDERAAKLVLLDHHKSAAEKLTGFACRCGVLHFDMRKSGARLAWEFFHPHQTLPALFRYVE